MSRFYTDDGPVYEYPHVNDFIDYVVQDGDLPTCTKRKGGKVYKLINCPCAFDIETTSLLQNDDKYGFMYIWMFGINGISIYGRTWDEFIDFINQLTERLNINPYKRLVCYIHNFSFEFQFFRKLFDWIDFFALDERKPMYAVTSDGIEFRCSYLLTGSSLAKVGDDLLKYKCKKMVGDLDYSLIRGSKTPMSEEELGYCINDIRVVMCKIKECLDSEQDIGQIPNTKTGYVRRDVKKRVLHSKSWKSMIQDLVLTKQEYEMLMDAFMGGFTHANVMHSGNVIFDVTSFDFTSSYPTVLIAEKYPMGNGKLVEIESDVQFRKLMATKCCLFDIKLNNLKLRDGMGDAPISASKCSRNDHKLTTIKDKVVIDNGRVREADELVTTITEQDFRTYEDFYTFDYEVGVFYAYDKGYLPKPIIEAILDYYVKKTTLKDVEGKEEDYQAAKANLNSLYGMMVMNIIRDAFGYNDNWTKDTPNVDEALEAYNNSSTRFNWFPWGVWCTAYARRNLFTGIYECGDDYIYSDTDSIKIENADAHMDYINDYNEEITEKLEKCLEFYKLDKSMLCPKTVEGEDKPLGVWDFDGHYTRFKTNGAKRYMVEKEKPKCYNKGTDEEFTTPIAITVAGVGKIKALSYMCKLDDPFEAFDDGLTIPEEYTGKLIHTYIDDEKTVTFTDYLGNTETMYIPSGIYMNKTSFTLGLSDVYTSLIEFLQIGRESRK